MKRTIDLEGFRPRLFDIHVDFVRHHTPIAEISTDRLRERVHLPEGSYDVGM
jgi:hypothetical protein